MDSMFEILSNILDAMNPLNTRRWRTLEMKQGKRQWVSWVVADYATAWEEAKMSQQTRDAFRAIMCICLTDNLYV